MSLKKYLMVQESIRHFPIPLRKSLKVIAEGDFLEICLDKKAQVSLEYFILFAVIAGLTLISASTFLPQVRTSASNLFQNAVNRILN